jgi:CheY-like chemotaxis protein
MENSRITLFHIEDDPAHRVLVARSLQRTGKVIEIESASSGAEALARLSTFRCDCILSDYHLPDMNALQMLEEIEKQKLPSMPIVVMTGDSDPRLACELLERGAQDYVVKSSVDGELLLRSIRYSMQRHHLSLELLKRNRELIEKSHLLEEQKSEILDKANRLAASERYRAEFLRTVSFNLRNPLNSLLVLSEVLCADSDGNLDENQRTYVRAFRESGNALLSSVEEIELLATSKAQFHSEESQNLV